MTAILALVVFTALLYLIIGIVWWVFRYQRHVARKPFESKLLRHPGHSLRIEMATFDERLLKEVGIIWLIIAVALSFFMVLVSSFKLGTQSALGVALIIFGSAVTYAVIRLVRVMRYYSDLNMGWRGECLVGEMLNELVREGCRVYHDIPGDGKWNIDHVVIAPMGVFVIETKTRRKKRGHESVRDYEVVFDGKNLVYPWGTEIHGIDQAKANARWLSEYLAAAVGQKVWVTPILTLPGWLVTRRTGGANEELFVLNPKEIKNVVLQKKRSPSLDQDAITRIGHALEQRCRDV